MSGATGKRHYSGKNATGYQLMSVLEEMINKEELLDHGSVEAADMDTKITLITDAILEVNKRFVTIHNMVNDASDGINPRITDCEEKLAGTLEENKQLRLELDILKGLFAKSEKENEQLRNKVTTLATQSIKNNIIISGIKGNEETEYLMEVLHDFLHEKMSPEFPTDQLITARRIGSYAKKNQTPRVILATLHSNLRELVLAYGKNLKGKLNPDGKPYRVSKQLPEEWVEQNRKLREDVVKAKKRNEEKSEGEEPDVIEVRKRTVYVNNQLQKNKLSFTT